MCAVLPEQPGECVRTISLVLRRVYANEVLALMEGSNAEIINPFRHTAALRRALGESEGSVRVLLQHECCRA